MRDESGLLSALCLLPSAFLSALLDVSASPYPFPDPYLLNLSPFARLPDKLVDLQTRNRGFLLSF